MLERKSFHTIKSLCCRLFLWFSIYNLIFIRSIFKLEILFWWISCLHHLFLSSYVSYLWELQDNRIPWVYMSVHQCSIFQELRLKTRDGKDCLSLSSRHSFQELTSLTSWLFTNFPRDLEMRRNEMSVIWVLAGRITVIKDDSISKRPG